MNFIRLLSALALLAAVCPAVPAMAQGCGPQNPNCIVPTAPPGTSNSQAASTAFVQQNAGYGGLNGDCTATSLGLIICTKTNGTPFGTMATQNASGVAITGGAITGMPNPLASSDVATKNYVDSIASGIVVLAPSGLATAAVLPNSPTYANGASGVGATLTAGSNTTLTVDGVAAPLNTVVLVKNQASALQNGIYTVTQAGSGAAPWILTRATYFDQAAEMKAGSYTLVTGGATLSNSAWTLQTAVTTVGTDALNWLLFSQGSASVSAGGALIASRAAAAVQNLSAYTSVETLGYAVSGDGGGAVFRNIGAAPFLDTMIATGSITAGGSGYVNGTYRGVWLTGGTGQRGIANVTVSGTAVTAVSIVGGINAGYSVGDVLSVENAFLGGTGSGFTWTVATITPPQGSFTDASGAHFQIVMPAAGLDARSMGVKFDWTGSDGGATDNFTAMTRAMSFVAAPNKYSPIDTGGAIGGELLLVKGTAMICGGGGTTFIVPEGVALSGQGRYSTVLKRCDAWNPFVGFLQLCDGTTQFTCYQARLKNIQLFSTFNWAQGSANFSTPMVYSNNVQDTTIMENVVLYPGACGRAMTLEVGWGGATGLDIYNLEIKGGMSAANCAGIPAVTMGINYGTTQVRIANLLIGGLSAGSGGPRDNGVLVQGGFVTIDGFHPEQILSPMLVSIPSSLANGMVSVGMFTGGADCGSMFTLQPGNTPGNFMLRPPDAVNGCTRLVLNQQGGSNLVGPVIQNTIFNP